MRGMLVVVGLAACDRLYSVSPSHHPDAAIDAPDGGSPMHCSPLSMVIGDFRSGTTFHTHWWDGVTTGPLAFTSAASKSVSVAYGSPSAGGSASLTAAAYLDLRESAFALSNTDSAAFASDAVVRLDLVDPSNRLLLTIQRVGGALELDLIQDGAQTMLMQSTYNPVDDRFWRIHHAGSTVTWETSSDGDAYNVRASQTLASLPMLRPHISIDPGASSVGFAVTIADVNRDTSAGTACPIKQLADKFDTAAIAPHWTTRLTPPISSEVFDNGANLLLHAPGLSVDSEAAVVSATIYDLTGGTLTIQQTARVSTPASWVRFGAETLDDDVIELQQDNSGYAAYVGKDQSLTPVASPALPWWRIREDHGLFWDVSNDGTTWVPYTNAPAMPGIDQVRIVIGVYQSSMANTAADARFDNLNE